MWPLVIGAVALTTVVVLSVAALRPNGGRETASGVAENRPVAVTGRALASFDPNKTPDPAVGTVIPMISGQSFDGTPVKIGPGQGPALLMAIAHWCPHCRNDVPDITAWVGERSLPAGVRLVAISTSVAAGQSNYPPSDWLSRENFPVTTLADDADDRAALALGVTSLPYYVAVDASGVVVQRLAGEVDQVTMTALMRRALGATGP